MGWNLAHCPLEPALLILKESGGILTDQIAMPMCATGSGLLPLASNGETRV